MSGCPHHRLAMLLGKQVSS